MSARYDYESLIKARERLRQAFREPYVIRRSRRFLRSGDVAAFYFDFDILANDPAKCSDIALTFGNMIDDIQASRHIDYLAFLEKRPGATVGAIRLAGAISIQVGIPNIVVRLNKELPFERVKVPLVEDKPAAQRLAGKTVVLVTDHVTRGREVLQAVEAIEMLGGKVTDVISYAVKPEYSREAGVKLSGKNVSFKAVFTILDRDLDGAYDISRGGEIVGAEPATA